MAKTIISYSLTGNNEALASNLAGSINAKHIRVSEPGKRSMGRIVSDTVLNRSPKIDFDPSQVAADDFVIFVGPVWMGKVASPLRTCFKQLSAKSFPYAFISVSGGADGPQSNDNLPAELSRSMGRDPEFVLDLHKADLLPQDPQPTRDMTMNYIIDQRDLAALTASAVSTIEKASMQ